MAKLIYFPAKPDGLPTVPAPSPPPARGRARDRLRVNRELIAASMDELRKMLALLRGLVNGDGD